MFELPKDQATAQEWAILRRLRIWIAALAIACVVAGIGIGAMLSGQPTIAQNELQIARAPEALSASFAQIARRVEPAVVNIETMTAVPEVAEKDDVEKDDQTSNNPLLDMFRRQVRRPSRGVGSGFILCAQAIALTGAPVLLIGKHTEKLRIAERRGIETATAKKAAARKRAFDVVVEASGSRSAFASALDLLRAGGVLVLKSTFYGTTEMDAARIVVDEISVVGSRCGRFGPALDLLKKGAIDVDSLISEEYPLGDGVLAMDRAGKTGVLKVLLRP